MREIKFRGLSFDKGWIYGNLIKSEQSAWIRESDYYNFKVKYETVGQYTGLKDKNGKEIYEGDIVRYRLQNHKTNEIYYENFIVEWSEETASYVIKNNSKGTLCIDYVSTHGELIGNIYDNKNLLMDDTKNGKKKE